MKRLLLALGLALAWVLPAEAGKILRQNADGTASWVNTTDGTETQAGEHAYTVRLDDIANSSTAFVAIPNGGRLKEVIAVLEGTIATATGELQFYISSPASSGGFFDQFTPVTPAIAEAATGLYQLQVPLSYAVTGQVVTRVWPVNSNTSLNLDDDDVIAIHTDGEPSVTGDPGVMITIIVH